MKKRSTFLITAILFAFIYGQAQTPIYEIRAVNKGNGYVGVEMRITSGTPPTTSDQIADLVFGLKWLQSYNVDLQSTITTSYNIIKSDVRKTSGSYYFQAFSAIPTPFAFPTNWTLNNWVEIMSVRNTMTGTGTGTFEVVETGFDLTTDPNFNVNLTDYTPTVVGSAINVPLPVKLTGFEALAKGNMIVVNWTTEDEYNSKNFEVERSENGSNNFHKVGTVNTKGEYRNSYEWLDKEVTVGLRYYYRLKQIDLDNKFQYSAIKNAKLEEADSRAIHIMPNPTEKVLQVVFGSDLTSGNVVIKITDALGNLVMKKDHNLTGGQMVVLNVHSLAGGQYYLSVEDNKGFLFTKAFLKK